MIDYAICDQDLFRHIANFTVKEPSSYSDHSPIITWININTINQNPVAPIINDALLHLPKQFIWENESPQKFRATLQTEHIQRMINEFLDDAVPSENVITSLDAVETIFTTTAKRCLKIKTTKKRRHKISFNKKWFDKECRLKRHELRKLANKKHRDPLNFTLREEYHTVLRQYKDLLNHKKNEFVNYRLLELENTVDDSDNKRFWNCLKSMDDTIKETSIPPVTEENWMSHFQSLHSNEPLNPHQEMITNQLRNLEQELTPQTQALDYLINETEIRIAVKKLKNNKSSFSDKIKNEMIKSAVNELMPVYLKLFNTVLRSGIMPQTWYNGIITPIFKSGVKSDPSNYRGICISSCLGKLFCSILNQRLLDHVKSLDILHKSQIGFLANNRTADHVLRLRTLIDKYVHGHQTKVYACFVDFRKAFDSVWHDGLLFKLLQYNVRGKFFSLIKSLYANSTCSVRLGSKKTRSFQYARGVRQGCILSPLLFNLYLNDLAFSLNNILSDPFVLPNGMKLSSLLYADDLIILSRSKVGLQNCLNTLSSYCNSWMLKINPKKTKIIIFQKCKRKCDSSFYICNEKIAIVQNYTYLGTCISSTGNFTLSLDHLRQKAFHALFSLRRNIDFKSLKPSLAFKIFDSMISPILTYNSEVWGTFVKSDFKSWDNSLIEKAHLQFCKRYLEVHNKASNMASRAELGKYPIIIDINKKILNYLSYLQDKDDNSIVKQSLQISIELYNSGQNSFYSNIMKTSEYFSLFDFNYNSLSDSKIKQLVDLMKKQYVSYWNQTLQHSRKLSFYHSIKKNYSLSAYLDSTRKNPMGRTLVKLRIGCHNLRVETGRYDKIPLEERICPLCTGNKIEDETHLLLDCQRYSSMRDIFLSKIEAKIDEIRKLSHENLISQLMNSNDYYVNLRLIMFISSCFEMRNKLI